MSDDNEIIDEEFLNTELPVSEDELMSEIEDIVRRDRKIARGQPQLTIEDTKELIRQKHREEREKKADTEAQAIDLLTDFKDEIGFEIDNMLPKELTRPQFAIKKSLAIPKTKEEDEMKKLYAIPKHMISLHRILSLNVVKMTQKQNTTFYLSKTLLAFLKYIKQHFNRKPSKVLAQLVYAFLIGFEKADADKQYINVETTIQLW